MSAAPSPALPLRSALGRGDLLRLAVRLDDRALDRVAAQWGYCVLAEAEPISPSPEIPEIALLESAPTQLAEPEAEPKATTGSNLSWAPLPFWRVESYEFLAQERGEPVRPVAALTARELVAEATGRCPVPRPIVPPARLRGWLEAATQTTRPGREVDTVRIVEAWSRGTQLRTFPHRAARGTTGSVRLLVDASERLMPFWEDQRDLERQLRRLVGKAALEPARGTEPLARAWFAPRNRDSWPLRRIEPGQVVLLLGDLGFLSREDRRDGWLRLGRELARAGARLHALVPCPRNRWEGDAARVWRAVDWQQPTGRQAQEGPRLSPAALKRRALRLLCLLSPSLRIEPALVRAVRALFPPDRADLGTEADLWARPELRGQSAVGAAFEPEAQKRWRARFERLPREVREAVLEVLTSLHTYLPRELRDEEVLTGELLGGLSETWRPRVEEARLHLARLARTRAEATGLSLAWKEALTKRVRLLSTRLPSAVWQALQLGDSLRLAVAALAREEPEAPFPAGYVPLPEAGDEDRRWRVIQQGEELLLEPWSPAPWEGPGSPIAEIRGGVVLARQGEGSVAVQLSAAAQRFEPANPSPLILTTSLERLTLQRTEVPDWATAAGRDRYSLWAAFEVKGVEHRMRWIPPGRFWMGSPEEEEGRWDNEGPRHEVELTRGFWLGEVPCTQDLWEAVMGSNPSWFRSPDRPVETVSWQDCGRFLKKLKRQDGRLGLRLPTEAEWEYACRAGTTASTYAEERWIFGELDSPVLDEIAWYSGNSGLGFELEQVWRSSDWSEKQYPHTKAGTRRVGTQCPNPWGLHDTLGNVWEWCQDFSGEYSRALQRDPDGASSGSDRVFRGGSWLDDEQYVRAAARGWYAQSSRGDDLGFRLARGQEAAPSQSGGGAPSRGVGAGAGSHRRNL
jgi:formylglycine-generating enzyme required for sulfatase activity